MINTKIPTKDKLELVYKFYKEVWNSDSGIIKDSRPEPPTVEQMENAINKATFPALKLLELENWWHRARMFYYMGGDESMLKMDGDLTQEDMIEFAKKRMVERQEEMANCPVTKYLDYTGKIVSYKNNKLSILLPNGELKVFHVDNKNIELSVNINNDVVPVTVTVKYEQNPKTGQKVSKEKFYSASQEL